jgi:radical SAM protein with 4Fe4S-binding SPASM domain
MELNTSEARRLIDDIARMQVPVFVLTGGDPLKREDIFELVQYAAENKVRVSLMHSPTPLLGPEALARLKECGLARLIVSLEGPTAAIHDANRCVPGSYAWSLDAIRWAREAELPVQINTILGRRNLSAIDEMIALLRTLDIIAWNIDFSLSPEPAQGDFLTLSEVEDTFDKLHKLSHGVLFSIQSSEAQYYRWLLQQHRTRTRSRGQEPVGPFHRIPQYQEILPGTETHELGARIPRAGKSFVFISHYGEVYPDQDLPVSGGNVRRQSLTTIYRDAEVFQSLRNTKNLGGKCGRCDLGDLCGGSRVRAYEATGDMFAEDPCCGYEPGRQL